MFLSHVSTWNAYPEARLAGYIWRMWMIVILLRSLSCIYGNGVVCFYLPVDFKLLNVAVTFDRHWRMPEIMFSWRCFVSLYVDRNNKGTSTPLEVVSVVSIVACAVHKTYCRFCPIGLALAHLYFHCALRVARLCQRFWWRPESSGMLRRVSKG